MRIGPVCRQQSCALEFSSCMEQWIAEHMNGRAVDSALSNKIDEGEKTRISADAGPVDLQSTDTDRAITAEPLCDIIEHS